MRTSFVLVLRLLVQAGTLLIMARLLGPHQFGAFAGIAALAVILGTLPTFGTHLVLLGEVSREPSRRQQVLRYAVPTTLLCGGFLLATYLLISILLLGGTVVPLHVLVAIGATEIWLQPLFSLPATEYLALGRTARSQLLTMLPLTLRLTAAAAVFLLSPADPLTAYSIGYFMASVTALVVATLTMPAPWPALRSWRFPNKAELHNTAGYAVLSITATGPAELDKTLAAKLLPLEAAGVYAAATRVIGATTLPIIAMMLAALPRLFREGQIAAARANRLLHWVFVAALGCSLLLTALLWVASPLFSLLFGPRYQGISDAMRWLTLAVPGMALRIAAGSTLMALGKPWVRAGFEATGLMMLVVAAMLLTRQSTLPGMPLALACSEWSMAILGWLFIITSRRSNDPMKTVP